MSLSQDDQSFLQRCQTSVFVPADVNGALDEILSAESEPQSRTSLYYDESIKVIVLLDVPTCTEEKLHFYISNLELRVDAWAAAISQNGEEKPRSDSSSNKDRIASVKVAKVDDPFTLVRETDDEVILQLAWEVRLDLGRPRLRAPHQTVTFAPIASITFADNDPGNSEFLEPFSTLEFNILEPLDGFPGIEEHPYLPASRLEKFMPPKLRKDDKIRIKHIPSDPIPTYAVVVPRLKYARINTSMPNPSTIATLDMDMIPILDATGVIEMVEVTMAGGRAIALTPDSLPIPWKAKDCLSFLYELQPNASQMELQDPNSTTTTPGPNVNVDTIAILIVIQVNYAPGTTTTIKMSWTANVDFSLALNPSYGAPSQPLQRTNRPESLTFTSQSDPSKPPKALQRSKTSWLTSVRTASTNLQHQVIPTSIQSEDSNIEITFVAPEETAHVAVPFSWRVLIVNNSIKPIKLAIVPLPRIQRPTSTTQQFAKRHAPKASNSSLTPASRQAHSGAKRHSRNALSTAKAVVEEQVLYALHHQAAFAAPVDTDLVSLTSELRIGPLGTGQCHETEIRFIAYKTGVFLVDAIRVVDLGKESEGGVGTINDIRELPEIIVVDAP